MSLWARISSSPQLHDVMKMYYQAKGLYEIRCYFAVWIEDQLRNDKCPTEQTAIQFYEDLKHFVLNSARTAPNGYSPQFNQIIAKLDQILPLELYAIFREGRLKEMEFVTMPMDQVDGLCSRIKELIKSIEEIRPTVQQTCSEFDQIRTLFSTINTSLPIKHNFEDRYTAVCYQLNALVARLKDIASKYTTLQKSVIDVELKNWQRQQALAGNGAPLNDNLKEIQICIELLVESSCSLIQIIDVLCKSTTSEGGLDELCKHVRMQQEYLILSAFIVEKQPPQVMKTHTRFAAAVRWLIGPQLGINIDSPKVECVILSEAQAQRHCSQRRMGDGRPHNSAEPQPSSGEILNNAGIMEYQQQTRVFSASFRNMQLKKIKRAEKKGTESVMDEKFALLFYASVVVNDYRIHVWTLSLPVVVIVHGNQEPQSWATITWDNAFSEMVREPFQVPDRVSWTRLSEALYTKYLSATGRGPTEDNKQYLYEKIFRSEYMVGDQKDCISWTQFCKEPLPDRTFTFWDWFFSTMKLTKDHLVGPWKAGLIVGFINKRYSEELLRQCAPGTFLLRFSDSELGGISVGFLKEEGVVYMLAPWTSKDLNVRGLAERVQDLEMLKYVYPRNSSKDVFNEFINRQEEPSTKDGYVRNVIVTTVPEMKQPNANATPSHSHSPNPHDIHMATHGFQNSTIMHLDSMMYSAENNMEDILNQFVV